jgi:hypothetical protein
VICWQLLAFYSSCLLNMALSEIPNLIFII